MARGHCQAKQNMDLRPSADSPRCGLPTERNKHTIIGTCDGMTMLVEKRNEIQWLRAIAACEVVICHSDLIVKHISDSRIVLNIWYQPLVAVGVELFFIVSGYIMCMRVPASTGWGNFIGSRISRIYPMYWLFTTVAVSVGIAVPTWRLGEFTNNAGPFIRSYLILPQWGFPILGVGWTLEYEMVFYVLVTAAMVLGVTRGRRMVAFACVLAGLGCIGSALGQYTEGSPLLFHTVSPYMFAFGAGWLFRALEQATRPERVFGTATFGAIVAVALWIGSEWGNQLLVRILVAALVFCGVLLARRAFQADNAVNRTLWLVGDASYSIYLSHWFVLSAGGKVLGALGIPADMDWVVRILGFFISVAVGIGSFRYIEVPLGRRLRGRRRVVLRTDHAPSPLPR
jgi:exopolysaccharide production protein ExoZ